MSVFQRLSQLALHKSAHHFQVHFHDVTDFYETTTTTAPAAQQLQSSQPPPPPAAEPERYYASCERNSKRYRTEPVAAIPKKQIGVLQSAAAAAAAASAAAASSDGPPRSLSLQQSQEDSSAASAAAAASSVDAVATPAAAAAARSSSCVLLFEQTLSFGCSLYRSSGSSGAFNKKVFRFRLKAVKPAPGSSKHAHAAAQKVDLYADVNLAAFASKGVRHATLVFPLIGKPDPPAGRGPPQLRCTITCMWMNDGAKDKDGYSSCSKSIGGSSHHTSGAGGASSRLSSNRYQAEFSRDRHSIYPRNASDARMFEFAGGGGGGTMRGGDGSREHSRVGVAFYGHDGSNVWDSQVGTIYDGFPPEQNAPPPQQQLNGGPAINPASSPSAAGGGGASQPAMPGLSIIRASANGSRTTSRVPSRVTSEDGRDMSDFELRQRRRDNEEKQQQAIDQLQQQQLAEGGGGSTSPHPPRRYAGSGRRENDEQKFSSAASALGGAGGSDLSPTRPSPHSPSPLSSDAQFWTSNTRPHSSSLPAMPAAAMTGPAAATAAAAAASSAVNTSGKHSRRTHSGSSGYAGGLAGLSSSPLSSPSSSPVDPVLTDATYVDLNSVDLLSGLQARDEAQQADHAAAAAAAAAAATAASNATRASILASFRHSPHSASASSVLLHSSGGGGPSRAKRPSIIQEEPQIHPAPSAAAYAAMSSASREAQARQKLQAIEDNRLRNAARTTAATTSGGGGAGAARFNAVIPAASLPLTTAQQQSGLTSPPQASRTTPASPIPQPSLIKTLSGRSSPAVVSGSLSARGGAPAASSSNLGGDEWMSSIRAQLPPVMVDPNSILVSTVPAAAATAAAPATRGDADRRPRSSSSSDSAPPPSHNSSASLFPPRKLAPAATSTAASVAPAMANGCSSNSNGSANGVAPASGPLGRHFTTPQPQLLPAHTSLSSLSFGAGGSLEISDLLHQSSDPSTTAESAAAAVTTASSRHHALRHYGHSDASAPPLHAHAHGGGHLAPNNGHGHSGHGHSSVVQQICSIHFDAFSDLARFREGNFGVIWRARMPAHLLPPQTHLHSISRARAASAGLGSAAAAAASASAPAAGPPVPMLDVVIKVPRRRPGPDEIAELFSFLNLPPHDHVLPFLGLCTDWRTPTTQPTPVAANATPHTEPGVTTADAAAATRTRSPSARGERLFCFVTELQKCDLKELALQLPPWRSATSSSSSSSSPSLSDAVPSPAVVAVSDPLLLLELLRGMCLGLCHFHACHSIHRDISLRNFLLSQANSVLLCDFGLSRIMETPTTHTQLPQGTDGLFGQQQQDGGSASGSGSESSSSSLPLRWLAPESLLSARFSYASDVWSFGVASWELVSQSSALPYAHVSNMREVVSLVCTGEMSLDFEPGVKCSARLAALLSQCLAVTPSKRPSMAHTLAQIEAMIREWYGAPPTTTPTPMTAVSGADGGDDALLISASDELQMSAQ